MNKILIALFALILGAGIAYAQDLRESVCIVCGEYTDDEKSTLRDFSILLSRKGFVIESRMLSAYKSGTFGSGAVVEADGKRYVLTNRHVVGYASKANVSFQLRGEKLTYEHCPVATVDLLADLALIALPESCTQPALPFAETEMVDGQDIIAVGFPGLDSKPSWQLTKGAVSNANLAINEVKPSFIQHTASIDPGSSGGPLLVSTDAGYRIVGVNTMKASHRDNVGFAIPVATVRIFLEKTAFPTLPDQQLLADMPVSAEEWGMIFDNLQKDCRDSLRTIEREMPLDLITSTLALECAPVSKPISGKKDKSVPFNSTPSVKPIADKKNNFIRSEASETQKSSSILASNLMSYQYFRAEYLNAFGLTQQVNLAWELNPSKFMFGVVTSLMLDESKRSVDAKGHSVLSPSFGLGIRFGAQVPLRMGKYYALPRFVLTPTIVPSGWKRLTGIMSEKVASVPISAGNDFAFPVGNYLLTVGVHYTYDVSFYMGTNDMIFDNNIKLLAVGELSTVGKSSLGVSFSVGW